MNVVGLDLSLTATGIAFADGSTQTLKMPCKGMERLRALRDAILVRVIGAGDRPRADLVVVEGYAMGTSRQAQSYAIGELGGVVRFALWTEAVTYVDVAPAALKKFACGKGNAKKDEVFAAAIRRLGYEGNSHDEADALWLRAMGLAAVEEPVVALPAKNLEALDAVRWPAVARHDCEVSS